MSHCDWFTWHVGTWSGVSSSEVVGEVAEVVGKVAAVVGEVAEVVGEIAEVVGEVAEVGEVVGEVPDTSVVTSSSPLKKSCPRLFQSKEWR